MRPEYEGPNLTRLLDTLTVRNVGLSREGLWGQPMAILLCEQYYDFAQALADTYVVMERGEVIAQGSGAQMASQGVRQLVAI